MTKNVELLLLEIEEKMLKVNLQLKRQTETNSFLINELEDFKKNNHSLSSQILILNQNLRQAELDNETLNLKLSQLNDNTKSFKIDILVEEIDQCINQIKANL